ncbi:DNA gyrase inhibitor YacG [Singulisphaera acidiphila]|uniref:DNA gyrase inhibitor YacG n=1 Tax=Singulisphaera acidiphila (strain ATCC BAA-1392 / DSM 18658 / VKM B-2454 / MOB10) TaxID=886293 RepID=L0DDR0_SINAD|nr:DNA gyrase inhibitor YacG [Singulisphaera acidiphila]AGA27367.1 hypothetical protein Sinac_3086 [Singulisphaera acidiphila DSM 18658]
MIRARCPTCSKSYEIESIDKLPSFPFCSDRCRLVDLGRWIDGTYAVPDDVAMPTPTPDQTDDEDDG